jgi:hypothetical protein
MKKLLFGMAFFMGAMMFGGGSEVNAQASVDPLEGEEIRWKRVPCADGTGGTFEICWLIGDGNICSTYEERTRYCTIW